MKPPVQIRACPAPAKLNLFLHVLGRRENGYHELQTVFDLLDLQDSLSFTVRNDGAIMRHAPIHGLAYDNDLSVRAARLLAAATETRLGADINVVKRIPVGGGLGGGSSNAATTLLALNRLWDINWPIARLSRLALQLGADVPVFVHGTAALAGGIGEKLTPIDLPTQCYVLVAPQVSVPTAEIFAAPELTRDTKPLKISPLSRGRIGTVGKNDLEPVACKRYPQVEKALSALTRAVRVSRPKVTSDDDTEAGVTWDKARMSGSGACVFLPVANAVLAEKIKDRVTKANVGRVFVLESIRRHPLRNWAFGRRI